MTCLTEMCAQGDQAAEGLLAVALTATEATEMQACCAA